MKALILGNRICQIVEDSKVFEVHESFKWVNCPDNINELFTYENGIFKAPEVQTQYDLERRMNYPPVGDQLDSIYKTFVLLKNSGINLGTAGETWVNQISAVKTLYPKP